MSKPIVLIAGILLLALSLQSQGDVPILLTKSYKKVRYAPEQGAKFTKIEAVKSLDAKGVLKLGGKSSARLYCNGAFKELEGKGAYAVGSLFQEELRYTPMGYANLLNDRLMAAIGGPKGSDTTSAVGGVITIEAFPITVNTPTGKLAAGQTIPLRWQSMQEVPEYRFIIKDGAGKEVHSATVNKMEYALDLGSLGLKTGIQYSWRVVQSGEERVSSNKYFFTITPAEEQEKVMKNLQEEEAYQQADPMMMKLMEGVWLENFGFYYAADKAYQEAARIEGKQGLSENMRRAFTRRWRRSLE